MVGDLAIQQSESVAAVVDATLLRGSRPGEMA